MVSRKIIQEWIDKAEEDFNFASQALSNLQSAYFAPICFHYQQAGEKIKPECKFLNDLYIESRYPLGEFKEYSRKDAQDAKVAAEKIRNFVKKLLKPS